MEKPTKTRSEAQKAAFAKAKKALNEKRDLKKEEEAMQNEKPRLRQATEKEDGSI